MAATIKEIKHWLESFKNENDMVGIDEGGLTLVVYPANSCRSELDNYWTDPTTATGYFDIGGVGEYDEDEDEEEDDDGEPQA